MALAAQRSRTEDLERAIDPATGSAELVELALHRDLYVRAVVAAREDCPLATLLLLAQDEDARVALAVLDNPHLPPSMLATLAEHRRHAVRDKAKALLASR